MDGKETTFCVSGLLYNTNLIPYDRATNSNWPEILNKSVNGSLIGEKAWLIPLVETDWGTWKPCTPKTKVVSTDTGFSRTYGTWPYEDYNTNNNRFLFPVPKDDRLSSKERVLAIVGGTNAKVYRFADFATAHAFRDAFGGKNYRLVGNAHFMVGFLLDADKGSLEFTFGLDGVGAILKDNVWDLFGEAVSYLRKGQNLKSAPAFMGFWFSIPAFYSTEVYGN